MAGVRRDTHLGHSVAKSVTIHSAFRIKSDPNLEALRNDIAIIELAKPLKTPPLSMVSAASVGSHGPFTYALYAKDRPYLLAVHPDCSAIEENGDVWMLNCDTVEGGSGGPILTKQDGRYTIVGIVVGYRSGGKSDVTIAIPLRSLER